MRGVPVSECSNKGARRVVPVCTDPMSHPVMAARVAAIHVFGGYSKVMDRWAEPRSRQDKARRRPKLPLPSCSGSTRASVAARGSAQIGHLRAGTDPRVRPEDDGTGGRVPLVGTYPDAYAARPGQPIPHRPAAGGPVEATHDGQVPVHSAAVMGPP